MEQHTGSGEHPGATRSEISSGNSESATTNVSRSESSAAPWAAGFPPKGPTEFSKKLSAAGFANWAKGLRISSQDSPTGESGKNPFNVFSNGLSRRFTAKIPVVEVPLAGQSSAAAPQEGALEAFAKGILDTSKNAVKAVQTKARHLVSQNKIRYQEDGFDLDLAYITDNIIAMGFPAGDFSSGLLGYVEGLYRNHMEEVIKFLETHHKDKYKVYNLCSERLYDASLFEGKVACFPFNDHNCPPLQLVAAFCQSAHSWLKADMENVIVVHCKAGKARTGLMISSLLLYLKFFPTAEESINYYNKKRCVDGKGLILPSQLRYVKYFERVLRNCNGETPMGRKVVLRGFRLHKCPYWIRPSISILDHNGIVFSSKQHPRTRDLMPEDIWFNAPRKGIMVFALPGERGLADLNGDFKVFFHDRHGDFYCWLNTNMMENRTMLGPSDLDGFNKRKLPSPGFQVEIVILDYDATINKNPSNVPAPIPMPAASETFTTAADPTPQRTEANKSSKDEKDDVFSDSESESCKLRKSGENSMAQSASGGAVADASGHVQNNAMTAEATDFQNSGSEALTKLNTTEPLNMREENPLQAPEHHKNEPSGNMGTDVSTSSDFKAIAAASAADVSVFTFGDEEDYESEED